MSSAKIIENPEIPGEPAPVRTQRTSFIDSRCSRRFVSSEIPLTYGASTFETVNLLRASIVAVYTILFLSFAD